MVIAQRTTVNYPQELANRADVWTAGAIGDSATEQVGKKDTSR